MSRLSTKVVEKIQFWENHIEPFTTNAVAIGITSAEATDLQTKTAAARAAYDARQAAMQAAEVATIDQRTAVLAMAVAGAALVKKIKGKAEQVGGDSVYALSGLPAPATPTSVGAPGTPEGLKAVLKPNGALDLRWTCVNPPRCTNVIYQVYRKLEPGAAWNYIGGTGARKFLDGTVPSGVPSVIYQIQGTRSTAVGDGAEFTVNFGVTAGGTMTASVTTGPTAPKMAA